MTRTILTSLALLMAASTLTIEAQAFAQPEMNPDAGGRTVEVRYDGGAIPFVTCFDCPVLKPRPGEKYITVEVIDEFSPVGYVSVVWDSPDGRVGHEINVCGELPNPRRIRESADLTLYPWMIPGSNVGRTGCLRGFSTSGTVRVTFLRDR